MKAHSSSSFSSSFLFLFCVLSDSFTFDSLPSNAVLVVARLREVHLQVSLEYTALHKARLSVEDAIGKVRRAIWVANQSVSRRALKPLQSDDPAQGLLKTEISVCKAIKQRLDTQLINLTGHYHDLNRSKSTLETLLEKKSLPLKLNTEGYASPVFTSYSSLHQSPSKSLLSSSSSLDVQLPDEAWDALDLASLSKTLRTETNEIIAQSIEEMTSANKTVLSALKDSINETRTLEVA
jgi:hypothetical protein